MFSQIQLDNIKQIAKRVKNQGEMAVYREILTADEIQDIEFTQAHWEISKFCAEECKRQRSGEMSVYDMVNAWNTALYNYETNQTLDMYFIEHIGKIVEPIDNAKGFRTIPIFVGNGWEYIEKAPWHRIPELLEMLLNSYYSGALFNTDEDYEPDICDWYMEDGTPCPNHTRTSYGENSLSKSAEDEFYFQYENIHPFRDGNGRSGKILYNYLKGTLSSPQMPPNFWNSSNP